MRQRCSREHHFMMCDHTWLGDGDGGVISSTCYDERLMKRESAARGATASDIVKNAMYCEGVEQKGRAMHRAEYWTQNMAHDVDDAFGWNSHTQKWKSLWMHMRMKGFCFIDKHTIHDDRDWFDQCMRCDWDGAVWWRCLVRGRKSDREKCRWRIHFSRGQMFRRWYR